jgi:hypothetical protein
MFEHRHEFGREKLDVAILVAACTVDRRDLDAADADARELFELAREAGLVDAAAWPPPARPGFLRALGLRPGGRYQQRENAEDSESILQLQASGSGSTK